MHAMYGIQTIWHPAVQERLQLAVTNIQAAQKGLSAVQDSLPDVSDTLDKLLAVKQEWESLARKVGIIHTTLIDGVILYWNDQPY